MKVVGKTGNKMLYQLWCPNCHDPYEVLMDLETHSRVSNGDKKIECPQCKKALRIIICPPKTIMSPENHQD